MSAAGDPYTGSTSPAGPASLAGSAFGRIEYGEAIPQRATTPIKQSRPQRFADLTKLTSATANYDMWASAAEPSNAEDSTCKWLSGERLC